MTRPIADEPLPPTLWWEQPKAPQAPATGVEAAGADPTVIPEHEVDVAWGVCLPTFGAA